MLGLDSIDAAMENLRKSRSIICHTFENCQMSYEGQLASLVRQGEVDAEKIEKLRQKVSSLVAEQHKDHQKCQQFELQISELERTLRVKDACIDEIKTDANDEIRKVSQLKNEFEESLRAKDIIVAEKEKACCEANSRASSLETSLEIANEKIRRITQLNNELQEQVLLNHKDARKVEKQQERMEIVLEPNAILDEEAVDDNIQLRSTEEAEECPPGDHMANEACDMSDEIFSSPSHSQNPDTSVIDGHIRVETPQLKEKEHSSGAREVHVDYISSFDNLNETKEAVISQEYDHGSSIHITALDCNICSQITGDLKPIKNPVVLDEGINFLCPPELFIDGGCFIEIFNCDI